MKNEVTEDDSMVDVVRREGISAVWLVPLIALLFGGWLLFKSISERGVFITVQFENGDGLVVGKTQVKYKGLVIGTVKGFDTSEDLRNVQVEIEMIKHAEPILTDKTLFWYVTADVSLQGVSGLDTLLSGSYITIQPDIEKMGSPTREFIALDEPPELDKTTPGLHLTLTASTLGSINRNSPVSFKKLEVGYVSGHNYDEKNNQVLIDIFIEPEYAHLVKDTSRFWNVSGFNVTGSLTDGIQINTESLAAIIAGGIAFDHASYEEEAKVVAQNGDIYALHADFMSAEMSDEIRLILDWDSGVNVGASINFEGITAGRITSFERIDPVSRKIVALVKMNPQMSPYLTTEAQFYIESPSVDLAGVTNLNQLLTGSQIVIRPALSGEKLDVFTVYNTKPAYNYSEPGLHLILQASNIDSLNPDSGVYFGQQQVGRIEAIENKGSDNFLLHVFIKPQFENLVSTDTRFWNASGLRFTGGLQNYEFQSQTLQTLLKGGIAFDIGEQNNKEMPENGTIFPLLANKDVAKENVIFEMKVPTDKNIKTHMRIMYRGEKIGSVHKVERHQEQALLKVGLLPKYKYVLREGTQFWFVQTKISLSGLTDTEALLGGSYFSLNIGDGEPTDRFVASMTPPKKSIKSDGLQLSMVAKSGNIATPGSPISYRGFVVGQVDNIELDDQSDNVLLHVTIEEKHRHLVNAHSRFYNASGVTITGNLSKLVVKTESVDTILTGGISFYNDKLSGNEEAVKEGEQFPLYDNFSLAEAAGTPITIYFNEIDGLKDGLLIKYKGQTIGLIDRLSFEENKYGVKAIAFLNDAGKKFSVEGSKFWLVKPELGLVGSQNLDAIVENYVAVLPGDGEKTTTFNAEDFAPAITALPYGLNLKLSSKRLGSVRVGNPVLYRQVKVGEVIGVDLASTADSVNIYINIADKYAKLVTAQSAFWNTSGLHIDAGLFSGVKVDSESIETLLAGGIAFATPEDADGLTPVTSGHSFKLNDKFQEKWHDWQPVIMLDQK